MTIGTLIDEYVVNIRTVSFAVGLVVVDELLYNLELGNTV